ncbi:Rieske 2Fe-2S domain-containing protein [Marinactinospora thermotolerans]|uniref:Cytochrome bc1 complex Rieske iron-sulfur subunit n=1 Tax=Marinactinospora thermotolerans DSM 45154 TaxID=1122192 RepID=A0A1T4ME93_9ACTN|nr:Rieske 2Fe-2S domain-containing protein [Marinactinospora thermotolerans]SJZ65176.1 menaquinol-cytochrome c reductase iron-sulfur subunit precursor [Marinactinospora thermotolerans DSM 45154]
MTDNNTNHDSGAGAEGPDRVIGTPSPAGESLAGATATAHERRHEGPYPAVETHPRPEEMQRKGEKLAALWFLVAFLAGIGFFVSYFSFPPNAEGEPAIADPQTAQYANMLMGGTIALALFAIGAGMTVWARRVMPHYEVSSPYDELPSSPEEKGSFSDFFMQGAHESGFTKRPLMRRTLLLAMVPLGLAPIVLLRDTGPLPGDKLKHTMWEDGMRMVVEGTDRLIRASDLDEVGGMVTALPESHDPEHGLSLNDQAKTVVLLIKMDPADFSDEMTQQQLDWTHDGIVAYSKICTHVGCPAALYEQTSHRILCPCHQSTFDAANGAKVVFGPAHRALPQLPVRVDDEGYLVAAGDFSSAVGPTFWDAEKGD